MCHSGTRAMVASQASRLCHTPRLAVTFERDRHSTHQYAPNRIGQQSSARSRIEKRVLTSSVRAEQMPSRSNTTPASDTTRCTGKARRREGQCQTHRMQDFVADPFEQERWQLHFRVRLGRQEKNHSGIQHHRHPVPEHLNHHTLPSYVTHRFPLAPSPTPMPYL